MSSSNKLDMPTHWARIGESTFVLGIWVLFWVYRLFGRWPFLLCLYPVVFVYWVSRPALRGASLQYLQRVQAATGALGHEPTWRDGLRHIGLFAETMLDKVLAVSGAYPFQHVQIKLVQPHAPGVIVTAHMGCLELCRSIAEQFGSVKLNILVHTRHAQQFNRILKRFNPANEVNLIEVSAIGPDTAILLAQKMAEGEYIVIAGDRVPLFASKTIGVDFLGHEAQFPVGPYVLANLLKCPLYFLGCIHGRTSYAIEFRMLAERVVMPRGQREDAMRAYAVDFAAAITALLKNSPYDWFNFFYFWDQAAPELTIATSYVKPTDR